MDPAGFPRNTPARFAPRGPAFHVSPSGADDAAGTSAAPYRSIARALRAAAGARNARVIVGAGTYLEGGAGSPVALRLERPGTVLLAARGARVTVKPAASHVRTGLDVRASRVSLRGIALEGFASCGVSIGVRGKTLKDIVLADLTITMPAGGDGISVWPNHSSSKRWVVDGLTLAGVRVSGADLGVTVGEGPIRSLALRQVVVKNRSNKGVRSGYDAIAVERGDNVLLEGVEVSGAEGDGIDLKATRVAVIGAHVHGTLRNGIKLWAGGDIINALVYDCGADSSIVLAGRASAATSYRIVNTMVAFHNRRTKKRAYAMAVGYDQPQARIELEMLNTVFHGNTAGIVISAGTRATFAHCLLGGEGTILTYGWDGSSSKKIEAREGPDALARAGRARNNLPFRTDPGLRDPNARALAGFRPRRRSPLVNAGAVRKPFPRTDLLGKKRVRGRRPDLGPIEAR